jgi:DnaK suppressor protein
MLHWFKESDMTHKAARNTKLRDILNGRRLELQKDVDRRRHDGRTDRPADVRDDLENSDAGISEDVEFALLEMKAQTLRRVDQALARLEAGEYGCCVQCGVEISEARLRALPFAVRCKACEEGRERGQEQTRRATSLSLFPPIPSS